MNARARLSGPLANGSARGTTLMLCWASLRADGLSDISCIKFTRDVLGVSLGRAKDLVHFSRAFADRREANEAVQDSLVGALREINKIEMTGHVVGGGVDREIGDLRAALAFALGMIRRQPGGPMGLTLLSVPTDGEIVQEVRRLREPTDRAEAQQRSTAADQPGPSTSGTDHSA